MDHLWPIWDPWGQAYNIKKAFYKVKAFVNLSRIDNVYH